MEEEEANMEVTTGFQIRNNENLPEPDSCSGKLKGGGDARDIVKVESVVLVMSWMQEVEEGWVKDA